jgi:hypothetical protein
MTKGIKVIRKISKGKRAINKLKAMELALVDSVPFTIPKKYISIRS